MKNDRRDDRAPRRETRKPAPRVELSACAEIGAYAFTA